MAHTINNIKKYWLGLFAVCYSLALAGQQVEVDDDRQSPLYGNIALTGLPKNIFDQIESKSFSDKEFSSFFYLRVGSSKINVLGSYKLDTEGIVFTPRFVPDASLIHWVHFDPASLSHLIDENITGSKIIHEVKFPVENASKTEVTKFYPNSDTLPANVLRAYIYFSRPMSLQNPYQFITIFDDKGNPVDEPFVEVTEGLWNEDRTRLTLFFHPGRIKRGVGPNMTKGNIFEQNRKYRLSVSAQWQDARGFGISPYEKELNFGAPVREKLSIDRWTLKKPQPNTLEPLLIKTPISLDHALSNRLLFVKTNDESVPGQWEIDSDLLKFFPDNPWKIASYKLIADEALEDICGNTLLAPFDHEVKDPSIQQHPLQKSIIFDLK